MKYSKSLLLFVFLCLLSCVDFAKGIAEGFEDNNTESLSESNFKTITIDSLYQLDVPKYMKNMPSLHPDASLEYANIYKEAYSVVIHENKQEFIDIFKEIDEYDDKLSPIENYLQVQKNMLSESINNAKFQDYGLNNINGLPARQIKVIGRIDGIDAFYIICFVEGEENIYMLMNWTLQNKRNKFENTFEYINGTFKLL
ncbi:MAG: hypothetical protein HKP48_06245 [Winogradskyella sp.]|uniref:hypothetical protein n=1 Tax=Winogradskyella sp. TaxID=1883156 RepID=UPI00179C967C|nr:hypothetical protein [Winogradskyella sp.]MBT8244768.1 hypothetical protein [Winogradskyella sp.]NNK22894.1 hypothetical protein [Winogradskyella sp.]